MLPIALRPNGRRAVIVGGGSVALRKAQSLAAAGFPIVVVAPDVDALLGALLTSCGGMHLQRKYTSSDLHGAALVIAATNDDAVNARVVADARTENVPVCDASDGRRGTFTMPAVLRAGDVTVSVDSGGGAPAFSKRLIRELAKAIGPQHGKAAETLAKMRLYAHNVLPSGERAKVLQSLAALPIDVLASMNDAQAEHEVDATVAALRQKERSPETRALTCASRASALAIAQSRAVAARLAERGFATTIVTVQTTGDVVRDRPIDRLGTGVFVKELEIALREGRADYAVHSCKDLPSELPADMQIVAISQREDARDVFCSERYESFESLPSGATVGTSSPRRRVVLAQLRPDLRYEEIRGNVDTRLRKLREGTYDAIVLAMAGLKRLGVSATHLRPFSPDVLVPAVGQGALAIEMRVGEDQLASVLRSAVNDAHAELCVACERAALQRLRAGCSMPVGIYARADGDGLVVEGFFGGDGRSPQRARLRVQAPSLEEARQLGIRLADLLMPLAGRVVLLPRTQERPSRIAGALRELGADVIELAAGDDGPDPAEGIPDMLIFPSSGSVTAAGRYLQRLRTIGRPPLVAAMGPQSREAACAAGFVPDAVVEEASVEAMVALACGCLSATARSR